MIGFFHTPKLLIGTAEKVAIERELLCLSDFFGAGKWRDAGLVHPEDFSVEFEESSIRQLFDSLCRLLDLHSDRIRLLFSATEVNSVSGMQWIHSHDQSLTEQETLVDGFQSDLMIGTNLRFESLLAEMVRMLVAQKLVLSGYADSASEELALFAEVATVFFGFGLFTINETVSCCQSTQSGYHYFSMVKLGALNSFGIGYLLALVLWQRNQTDLKIGNYLRPDAELSYQKSLEYLDKTRDTLLVDTNLARIDSSTSISTVNAQLQSGTPTGLLWILESIQNRAELARDVKQVQSTLFVLTKHRDAAVARMALHLISFVDQIDSVEVRQLQKIARGRDLWMSAVAANVLSTHLPFGNCENEFARLLERIDHDSAANAAQMANRFGTEASKYESIVCQRIKTSLNRCNYGLGFWYTLILIQISSDARGRLDEEFAADEDLLRGADELFSEASGSSEIHYGQEEVRPQQINDIFAIPAWLSI